MRIMSSSTGNTIDKALQLVPPETLHLQNKLTGMSLVELADEYERH